MYIVSNVQCNAYKPVHVPWTVRVPGMSSPYNKDRQSDFGNYINSRACTDLCTCSTFFFLYL